ncbi:ABC transporter permease [Sphingomonas qomolangmaensis]|uniref:ABC transporter permease n=1 Tax=Sphingomonas qomolangmaensis TaxID=2918765 RepID=A0ABY5L6C2_9SPHN|nr:ABC transporter permease [Sphingomonas qomolangmaensis]UUL82505.1 ABC transporter permease [Sphingomonas qomolangmaensis]
MNALSPSPTRPASGWIGQTVRLTTVETATYLRDRTAIFWTFVYPVVLLMLMMTLFGGGGERESFKMALDVEGRGATADRVVAQIQRNFSMIDGIDFELRKVAPDQQTPAGRVRLVVPDRSASGTTVPLVVQLNGTPDASSGSMLSLVAQSASELNVALAGIPPRVTLNYDLTPSPSSSMSPSVYYVVGLAVLTIVSTALFGFSGPLIDLRARGGLKLFQFMPVYRTAFLTAFALCRVIILFVFVTLFIVGGLALFGGLAEISTEGWVTMIVLNLFGTVSFLAAGLAIAGFVTSNTLGSALINIINLPIIFLSDLFIPLNAMPDVVQSISKFTPVYLLVDAMRGAAAGTRTLADCGPAFVALTILFIVSAAFVAATFRWRLKR